MSEQLRQAAQAAEDFLDRRWRKTGACDDDIREHAEALRAALAEPQPEPVTKEHIAQIVRDHMTGLYYCGRVWGAWAVGTMSKDDFTPATEIEAADEIADAIVALYSAPQAQQPLKERPNFIAGYTAGLADGKACAERDAGPQPEPGAPMQAEIECDCLVAWSASTYGHSQQDTVHPMFLSAFIRGYRAAEKAALQAQQPQPEPVAYKVWHPANPKCSYVGTEPPSEFRADTGEPDEYFGGRVVPLYAAPQAQQPLTDSEINRLMHTVPGFMGTHWIMKFARAIEAHHKIGAKP